MNEQVLIKLNNSTNTCHDYEVINPPSSLEGMFGLLVYITEKLGFKEEVNHADKKRGT